MLGAIVEQAFLGNSKPTMRSKKNRKKVTVSFLLLLKHFSALRRGTRQNRNDELGMLKTGPGAETSRDGNVYKNAGEQKHVACAINKL